MTQVILVSGNPLAMQSGDLQPLMDLIRSEYGLSTDVYAIEQRDNGVTWWEVLQIYVGSKVADALIGHVLQQFLDGITEKAKDWYRDKRQKAGTNRPFHFILRDGEGRVLRAFKMEASGEIEDVTKEERRAPARPLPIAIDNNVGKRSSEENSK